MAIYDLTTGFTWAFPAKPQLFKYPIMSSVALMLLDLYPGATAAYSLRKLRKAYIGACIRVRRSSDNSEQDIGFSGNVLDTVTLLNFVGAGNGHVVTWYDQSLTPRNISQSIALSQPMIINTGVIYELSSGKPSVKFISANTTLLSSATGLSSNDYQNAAGDSTTSIVFKSAIGSYALFGFGSNGLNLHAPWADGNTYFDTGSGARLTTPLNWNNPSQGTFSRLSDLASIRQNGVTIATNTNTAKMAPGTSAFVLGANAGSSLPFEGLVSEYVHYGYAMPNISGLETTTKGFFGL